MLSNPRLFGETQTPYNHSLDTQAMGSFNHCSLCYIIIRCIPAIVGHGIVQPLFICVALLFDVYLQSQAMGSFNHCSFVLHYYSMQAQAMGSFNHCSVVLHYYSMYTCNSRLWGLFNHCSYLCYIIIQCKPRLWDLSTVVLFVLHDYSMYTYSSRPQDRSTIVHLCVTLLFDVYLQQQAMEIVQPLFSLCFIIIRCMSTRPWDRSTIVHLRVTILFDVYPGHGIVLPMSICVTVLLAAYLGHGIVQPMFVFFFFFVRCWVRSKRSLLSDPDPQKNWSYHSGREYTDHFMLISESKR